MSAPITIVVLAVDAQSEDVKAALESALGQVAGAQILVSGRDPAQLPSLAGFAGDFTAIPLDEPTQASARNAAIAQASAPYLVVVDGHERLAKDALRRHLEALDVETDLAGSYGRTAIHDGEKVRVRPEHGKGGPVFTRLLKEKHLIPSSACLVWRKDALGDAPFDEAYGCPAALRLDMALKLARVGELAFHPSVLAERRRETLELHGLEEMVKVLLSVLYSDEPLGEKLEQRARFRLARHLVAIGKQHYRNEDYRRAGKFFDEAVKAAPGYFKGRRYQFMNFVKNTMSRAR